LSLESAASFSSGSSAPPGASSVSPGAIGELGTVKRVKSFELDAAAAGAVCAEGPLRALWANE
jgi:hypothetical protein